MADDEDAIYVDVKARLDEASADEVEEKLRDKLKGATKDLGRDIKDALGEAKDDVKDLFGKDNIREALRPIKEALGEAKDDVGDLFSKDNIREAFSKDNIREAIRDVRETISDAFHTDTGHSIAKKVTDAIHSLTLDDIRSGVSGANNLLGGVPELDRVQTLLDRYDQVHGGIKDTVNTAKELAEGLGLGGLASGALAPLLAPEVTVPAAIGGAAGWYAGEKLMPPSTWGPNAIPGFDPAIAAGIPRVGVPATPGLIAEGLYGTPGGPDAPTHPILHGDPGRMIAPTVGPTTVTSTVTNAQSAMVQASVATISAGSLNISGVSLPSTGGSLSQMLLGGASHSSSSVPSGSSSWSGSSWFGRASGGVIPGDSPGYDNMLGMLGGRPIGLEGGEFVVNPAATQSNLSLLQAINASDHFDGGGMPGGGTDVHQSSGPLQSILGGSQVKPGPPGSMAPQPMKAAGEPSPAQTIIPQGQGKGFSISGGVLGGAEGAAAGAADMFAPGSGAAVQIAMQEANRAIEFGVKAGITAGIEAPLDTFWLSDSGLSDPSHSWFGKLGLNLIGQTGGLAQNLAGKTQAPLTPGGGQGSPLGGQQKPTPGIHIENQYNNSDVDHMNNNQSLLNGYSAAQHGAYTY
jgi:hypothetical protein